MAVLDRVTTKDVIAVLVVGGCILFNGISLLTGRPVDAATIGLAGAVVGHYFRDPTNGVLGSQGREEPLAPPDLGEPHD